MIYLLRHAESFYNATKIDEINTSLSDKGIKQARELEGEYDLIYCSPLLRCRQTLQHSKITANDIQILELIREHKTNKCDFMEGEEYKIESELELLQRVCKVKKILEGVKDKKVLLVGHADFFWYLTSKIIDGERFGTWLDNAISECLESKI